MYVAYCVLIEIFHVDLLLGNNPVRRFTATEDKLLLMGLHQIGVRNWPTIEEYYVPSRSVKQLIAHYYKLKCKKSDEPNPFRVARVSGVGINVNGYHGVIATSHQDYEQESLKPFTDEEARQLRLGVEQYGANFSCITAHVLRHKPPSILRAQWTEMMPGSGKASKGGTAATAGAANSRKRKGGGGALLDLPLLENVSRQSNVGTAPMTMALPEMGRTRGPTPVGGMPTASVHNTGSSKRTRTTAQHQPLPHHYGHGVSSTGLSMPLPPPTASQPPAEDEIARLFSMEELFFDYS